MIKISDVVSEIIQEDLVATEAMRLGILNLSAYASQIKHEVEARTLKEVKTPSIVVALSRLEIEEISPGTISPYVPIRNISVKGSLAELTYEKTESSLADLSRLDTSLFRSREFFAITEGLAEITIVCPREEIHQIESHFSTLPKSKIDKLVAITVRFPPEFLNIPNAIYTLVSALAIKRINLAEVISTYTELSFVVQQENLELTLASLHRYME